MLRNKAKKRKPKYRHRWFRILLRRRILIILALAIQLFFILYFIINTSMQSTWISTAFTAISFVISLFVVNSRNKDAYKLMWVFLILTFPIFGWIVYLLFNFQSSSYWFNKTFTEIETASKPLFYKTGNHIDEIKEELADKEPIYQYLQNFLGYPVYTKTKTKYLSPGEKKFEELIRALERAEKYIFLEYFIIEEGVMWDKILDILLKKVHQGVEVRIIYDDIGCFFLLPKDYAKYLNDQGIQCIIFNKFRPFLSVIQNNRDHRKIAVIDGKIAFTGGINLADEYINVIDKHGHWKDSAVMLEGEGAWSFTIIFLQMWAICKNIEEDFMKYYPWGNEKCIIKQDGYVQPYADSPIDDEHVVEHIYLQILNNAKKYVYINTPYLIIDQNIVSALKLAAKSGIDIRIVTPYHGDKFAVHATTRSYYRELIKAGIKIYEYSKGFIHAKSFVSDDIIASVGTTNLDYRSLYLHFECGTLLYKTAAVKELYDDYMETLNHCHLITEKDCRTNIVMRLLQDVFRLFAPLM